LGISIGLSLVQTTCIVNYGTIHVAFTPNSFKGPNRDNTGSRDIDSTDGRGVGVFYKTATSNNLSHLLPIRAVSDILNTAYNYLD